MNEAAGGHAAGRQAQNLFTVLWMDQHDEQAN